MKQEPRRKGSAAQRQARIEAERDRLQAIFDSMDDGIYIVGRDYRIEFINRALRREMGSGEGQFCHDFFCHSPSLCRRCQHEMGSFGPELRHEWHLPVTGKTFDMIVSPLHQPDGSISRLHILRDVTERRRLEAELQEYSQNLEAKVAEQAEKLRRRERLALLGEISAGLAHEIRTPLGAIITGIKLLEQGAQDSEERELIFTLLKRETARLEGKVSEFLAYAKPRLPQLKPTHPGSILEEVRAILATDRPLLGNVTIKVTIPPDLPPWPMDGEQIKEVLLNLGVNGLQSLQGKGTLSFQAHHGNECLEIVVRDDGPGIPADALPHIFKPFYSRRSGGTGLGLAICQQIIENHGGYLSATSLPGHCTAFRISLPWRTI
jgi:two-component system, NtrC family, sensor histidine kinase HydH